ncbi:hypothetical protein HDU97_001315 [Phlyctochytrium planicorne]|nr:hypothetical protein HDU97_001315 [Phlyctochytrium planicorne]
MLKIKSKARSISTQIDRSYELYAEALHLLELAESLHHDHAESLKHMRKCVLVVLSGLDGLAAVGFHSGVVRAIVGGAHGQTELVRSRTRNHTTTDDGVTLGGEETPLGLIDPEDPILNRITGTTPSMGTTSSQLLISSSITQKGSLANFIAGAVEGFSEAIGGGVGANGSIILPFPNLIPDRTFVSKRGVGARGSRSPPPSRKMGATPSTPTCPEDQADPVPENPFFLFCQFHVLLGRMAFGNNEFEMALLFFWEGLVVFPAGVEARWRLAKGLRVLADRGVDLGEVGRELGVAVEVGGRLEDSITAVEEGRRRAEVGFENTEESEDDEDEEGEGDAENDDEEELEATEDMIATETFQRELEHARLATDLYILHLCQESRSRDALEFLKGKGYLYRLSNHVLRYALPSPSVKESSGPRRIDVPFVRGVDRALPTCALHHMRKAFGVSSRFWSEHRYGMGVPYFSYVHKLKKIRDVDEKENDVHDQEQDDDDDDGEPISALDQVIGLLHAQAVRMFPEARNARYAEWWAHCRPHCDGHQLHFDSDDEGRERMGDGRPHHPIVSSVLYLTDGGVDIDGMEDDDEDASGVLGGPTLVTNQRIGDGLADRGWLVFPKVNRYTVFDGSVLHGVVPGRGVWPNHLDRRVTFMVAFWDDINVKSVPGEIPGSSRPYPYSRLSKFTWPRVHDTRLDLPESMEDESLFRRSRPVAPIPLESVWTAIADEDDVGDGEEGDDEGDEEEGDGEAEFGEEVEDVELKMDNIGDEDEVMAEWLEDEEGGNDTSKADDEDDEEEEDTTEVQDGDMAEIGYSTGTDVPPYDKCFQGF